jgi:cyclopropane-fatty-acyl-phospholipid synthase
MGEEIQESGAGTATESLDSHVASPVRDIAIGRARTLLRHLFSHHAGGVTVRLWEGKSFIVGKPDPLQPPSPFTLVFRSARAVRALVLGRDPLRLAEAYIRDDIDVEGDFISALTLKDRLGVLPLSRRERLAILIAAVRLTPWSGREERAVRTRRADAGSAATAHTKGEDLRDVQFHYDLSNEFYSLWLDESMVYSCAYFEEQDGDLDSAQQAKLDHICRKLIAAARASGCSMSAADGARWCAGRPVIMECTAHGITLSQPAATRRRASRIADEPGCRHLRHGGTARLPRSAGRGRLRQGRQHRHVRARRAATTCPPTTRSSCTGC